MYTPTHLNFYVLSGYCNARCIMCPVHDSEKQIMSFSDFKAVVDNCSKYADLVEYFTLSAMGEPLIHKDVVKMVRYAKDKGFRNIGMISNASLLTAEKSRELILSGLNTLMVSIDTATEETYGKIRKGLDYSVLLENVHRFIALRDELAMPARVIVKFLQQEINDGEWAPFLRYWTEHINPEKGDEVVKTGLHNWGGQLSVNENKATNLCKELERYLHISSDRKAMLCCLAPAKDFSYGDMAKDDMLEVFNSVFFNKFRCGFLNPDDPLINPCHKCNFPVEYGY